MTLQTANMDSLELSKRIRVDALRITSAAGASHIGSVFSVADILAVLYADVLDVRPDDCKWSGRDRFILSKGHAGAGVSLRWPRPGSFRWTSSPPIARTDRA